MSKKNSIVLLTILLCALFLRVYQLVDVPPGLNRDEASLGYTAYSVLKTGRDEHGVLLPISLKSFGDWKLPLYAYVSIPPIAILGLSELAIRLPSVLAGLFTILLTYQISRLTFKKESIALVAAGLLSISPWHVFFSRVASEANLAVFLVSLGLYLFLKRNSRWHIPAAFSLWALTLLTYHGNHVFTLLFVLGILVFYRKEINTKIGFISFGIFSVSTLLIFGLTLSTADKTKVAGLLSINDKSIVHEQIEKNRLILGNDILAKLLNNRFIYFIEHASQNYLKSFSPEFLFIAGGGNRQHNIPDFGNIYLVEAPFLVLGIIYLLIRREKSAPFLLFWLAISAVGASLTKDAPHSARQFAIFPALTLVTAYGLTSAVNSIPGKLRRVVVTLVVVAYIANFLLFVPRYFVLFPFKEFVAWGNGYKELVGKIIPRRNDYAEVIMARPDFSPYIYYLFYTSADPQKVQHGLNFYPETPEGFMHVKSYDGITYQKIDWAEELLVPDRLYIDWVESIPSGATSSALLVTPEEILRLRKKGFPNIVKPGDWVTSQIVDRVILPDGTPYIYLIATQIGTPSAVFQDNFNLF